MTAQNRLTDDIQLQPSPDIDQFLADFGDVVTHHVVTHHVHAHSATTIDNTHNADYHIDMSAFASYIQTARNYQNLSVAQLAQKIGRTEAFVVGLENGLVVSADVDTRLLCRLATALDEDIAIFAALLERPVVPVLSSPEFVPSSKPSVPRAWHFANSPKEALSRLAYSYFSKSGLQYAIMNARNYVLQTCQIFLTTISQHPFWALFTNKRPAASAVFLSLLILVTVSVNIPMTNPTNLPTSISAPHPGVEVIYTTIDDAHPSPNQQQILVNEKQWATIRLIPFETNPSPKIDCGNGGRVGGPCESASPHFFRYL